MIYIDARQGRALTCAIALMCPVFQAPLSSSARSMLARSVQIEETTIRILSYKIKHGQGMDEDVQVERAARLVNELEPDLVALQEIDNGVRRPGGVDQAARLGEWTDMHAVFGEFMHYQGGQYGVALLSKFPFMETVNHRLPPGAEPRSALAARVAIGASGVEIILAGIHRYRTAGERYAQAVRRVEILEQESPAVILTGAFNSTPGSDVIRLLGESWTTTGKGADNLTFPSTDPRREIDCIMDRPRDRFEVLEQRVIDEPLVSDHRPVLLVLRVRR
jgi:endonuclease/exonuclease/phosphatase family metal-dependent hydrolase